MTYLYLAMAIVAEVIATSALKASDGFTRIIPSIVVILGYGAAFYLLSIVLRTFPVGIAYAIWCAFGIVLISVIGFLFFDQRLDLPAITGLTFIIIGVIIINVFSKSISH